VHATVVRKASQGRGPGGEPTIIDLISDGGVDMVVNTPNGQGARADGYEIRASTTAADKPIITTVQEFGAAVLAIEALTAGPYQVRSLQDHDADRAARHAAAGRGTVRRDADAVIPAGAGA
jgi:carbamoyl-phosphate synthase large subunit